jgi:DNA polymerase III delta prime subunit
MLTENLFWEKYRPKIMEDVVLPDRIRNMLTHGIQTNMIFTGPPGCGKTTCARILLKNYHHKIISAKQGVDVLRNEIDDFCRKMIVSFDSQDAEKDKRVRVVYFEEFDRATNQLQEELKSFIEDHSSRVRFIATCNNINEINEPIQSRFNVIDFTPIGQEESVELKRQYAKRVVNIINSEKLNIPKEEVKNIISKNFPDFRKIWQHIQYFHLSGYNISKISVGDDRLFEIIFSDSNSVEVWDYVYNNWLDKPTSGFNKLGRDFFLWVKENKPEYVNKLGDAMIVRSEYADIRLPRSMDNFLTFYALVCRLQQIFK